MCSVCTFGQGRRREGKLGRCQISSRTRRRCYGRPKTWPHFQQNYYVCCNHNTGHPSSSGVAHTCHHYAIAQTRKTNVTVLPFASLSTWGTNNFIFLSGSSACRVRKKCYASHIRWLIPEFVMMIERPTHSTRKRGGVRGGRLAKLNLISISHFFVLVCSVVENLLGGCGTEDCASAMVPG